MHTTSAVRWYHGTVPTMIAYLNGVVRPGRNDTQIVVVSGVGYLVHTPRPFADGDNVELHVTSITRDTGTRLYGFETVVDQQVFDALCAVPAVGPSTALSLIGALGADGVVHAAAAGDEQTLTTAPGIGKKGAHAIVTLANFDGIDVTSTPTGHRDVVDALVQLGFDIGHATDVVAAVAADNDLDDNDVLRAALVKLGS